MREMRVEVSSDGISWTPFTMMHKLVDRLCRIPDWWESAIDTDGCREVKYDMRRVSHYYFILCYFLAEASELLP